MMDNFSENPPILIGVDKILVIVCHLSTYIAMPILFPFVLFLAKKNESPRVAQHAKQVLNFHLSLLLYILVATPLVFILIGFVLITLIGLFGLIFGVIGAVKASEDICLDYPLSIRFFK